MPIYEYRRADGSTFEVMQSMSEDTLTVDPETGEPVTKVLHAPSIHFKGSGFYNTDYGKQKNRGVKNDGEGGSSGGDSGSEKGEKSSSDSSGKSDSSSKSDSGSKSDSKSSDGGSKSTAKTDSK